MKKLLVLVVALCLLSGTAVAKEAHRQQLMMMEGSQGLFNDIQNNGLFGVAQAGTTWIGWTAAGSGPYKVGSPGIWDFDDGGTVPCPTEDGYQEYIKNGAYAQGWTSEDVMAQDGLYWHAEDFTDPGFGASPLPIAGTYSAWCGKVSPAPLECFLGAPGYGSNWNQWMCKTVTLGASSPKLDYSFKSNSEPGFDYCYVFIDSEFPDSCGWVGDNSDTLRCYDGPNAIQSESITLSSWVSASDCDDVAFDTDYTSDYVKICFVVVSDGGWDDEDAGYDTVDGAFAVDDVSIDTNSGTFTDDFESGMGAWTICGGFAPGDYVAIRDQYSFINASECEFTNCTMSGCVLTFYNPDIPGQFGDGGHYGDGQFYKRAWSPTVDLTSYPTRGYVINTQRYGYLPIANWVFYRYYTTYVQDVTCPTGAWSPPSTDSYVYYLPIPICNTANWGCSQFIPVDADSVKIGLAAWTGCIAWGTPCTTGNSSPVFDDIRLGIWDLSAPLASIRAVDNYTDSFPEDDALVATNTGLIDAANNKSQEGYFLRMADSAVISLDAPNVMAEMCFSIEPGPGTNLTDPFFTTMYPGSWSSCTINPDMYCTRMDTAFAAGDGDTASAYYTQVLFEGYFATMIHESDGNYPGYEGMEIMPDSLFTPGTKIYYTFRTSFLPGPGPYNYLPFGADVTTPDYTTWYEVEVLPDLCKDPLACLLYVDYYNRGAQGPIEAALTLLGRTWDRFDMRAESSHQGNGIGNRLLGPGRYRLARGPIGPSLPHLAQYKAMLINNGNFGTGVTFSDGGRGTPDDPTNDVSFLDDWISEGFAKGLWLSGNNIAADFATTGGASPKPGFLNSEMGTALVDANVRNLNGWDVLNDPNCICVKTRDGEISTANPAYQITNKYAVADSFFLTGISCPQKDEFDVITKSAAVLGRKAISALYCGQYPAAVDHIYKAPNPPFDTVRTRMDGFSVHQLRDDLDCNGATLGVALWIRDVLGGNNNNGFFYDRALHVQYCPPQGAEDPTLDVPRGGRTYSNALFQNYPNPFRGGAGTTIHYSVAKAGQVEIRIFDVAGRLVSTITDQAKLGDNFVVWDGKGNSGRSVASGVYFYQIKTDKFSAHKKMLLVN